MKPLTLKMQAFGCYQQEVELDFSALENRLFLITGATGGGKTTLLDAICFALYCRATGGKRAWSAMRSLDAPFEAPTYVEFSFSLAGERYRFYRSLRMHRVRGTDRIEQREEHSCWQWRDGDWALLENGAESKVRDAAQRLLGLSCEQFSQVIMLPQGEFRKLLLSNSTEKARILQALFQTERWERLTHGAQRLAEEHKARLDQLEQRRAALLRREGAEDLPQLEQRLKELLASREALTQQSEQLEAAYRAANERYTTAMLLEEQYRRLDGLKREQGLLLQQAETFDQMRKALEAGKRREQLSPYYEALCRCQTEYEEKQKRLQEGKNELQQAEKALAQARQDALQTEKLREQAANQQQRAAILEAACQNAQRLEFAEQEITKLEVRLAELEGLLAKSKDAASAAEQNVRAGEQFIQTITLQAREEAELLQRLTHLEQAQQALEERQRRQSELEQAQKAYRLAEQESHSACVELQALQKHLEEAQALLRQDLAAQLAQGLQADSPCPVCGSMHHPHPARPMEGLPPEELELLRASVRKKEEQCAGLRQALAASEAMLGVRERAFAEQEALWAAYQQPADQLKQTLLATQKAFAAAQNARKKLPRAEALLEQRKNELEQARKTAEQSAEQMQTVKTDLAQARSGAQAMRAGMPADYKGLAQLQQALGQSKQQAAACERQAAALEQRLAYCSSRVAAVQAAGGSNETACREAEAALIQAQTRFSQECALRGQKEQLPIEKPDGAALNRMEQQLKDYERQTHAVKEQLEALEGALQASARPEIERLKAERETAQEASRRAAERLGGLQQACESVKVSFLELSEIQEQSNELQRDYGRTQRLAQLMAGGNACKVPLRMFVLGMMLDDIVSQANLYFATLSSGRYALTRPEQPGGGRGYSGLELKVMDAYCGGLRPVETLSGGELFLASLSLAFGLSDVVQSYSGGVHLDSIFIDEGFGSLDQDTLDIAMKALEEIHKAGRTVGIISHVNELKSRIGAKIVVTPTQGGGSTARIVL